VPRLKNPIKDIGKASPAVLREEKISLTPETYAALVALAERKLPVLELVPTTQLISKKKALQLALTWVRTGSADPRIVQKLHRTAPFKTQEQLYDDCISEFLAENKGYKLRKTGENDVGGRPKGYIPRSKRLKIAIGEVISELINTSIEARKLLKTA